jgi:hypothetical protein
MLFSSFSHSFSRCGWYFVGSTRVMTERRYKYGGKFGWVGNLVVVVFVVVVIMLLPLTVWLEFGKFIVSITHLLNFLSCALGKSIFFCFRGIDAVIFFAWTAVFVWRSKKVEEIVTQR